MSDRTESNPEPMFTQERSCSNPLARSDMSKGGRDVGAGARHSPSVLHTNTCLWTEFSLLVSKYAGRVTLKSHSSHLPFRPLVIPPGLVEHAKELASKKPLHKVSSAGNCCTRDMTHFLHESGSGDLYDPEEASQSTKDGDECGGSKQ